MKQLYKQLYTPYLISYKGITATPEQWACMVGVTIRQFKRKANELGSWKKACELENYAKMTECNIIFKNLD
jgi:hypothetical protein